MQHCIYEKPNYATCIMEHHKIIMQACVVEHHIMQHYIMQHLSYNQLHYGTSKCKLGWHIMQHCILKHIMKACIVNTDCKTGN